MDSPIIIAGKYRLLRKLGQGGMGSVWYAEHLTLHSAVAIKLIDPSIATNEEALGRFLREAQAAASLRSPHVVQILDHGIDGASPYIVMELLEGESLADRLTRLHRLSPVETARVMQQVARAVARAHEAGIVHRDLKPDNIFLVHNDDDEVAKVLDFGIAKSNVTGGLTGSASGGTRTGAVLGTPYYMSPEQAEGARTLDGRSDIWAMGVIAYECILGARPFDEATLGGLLLAICARPPPIPSQRGAVPAGFDHWFTRVCARDPNQRYANAREAMADLRQICENTAAPADSNSFSGGGTQVFPNTPSGPAPTPPYAQAPGFGATPNPSYGQSVPGQSVAGYASSQSTSTSELGRATAKASNAWLVWLGAAVVVLGVAGAFAWPRLSGADKVVSSAAPEASPSPVAVSAPTAVTAPATAAQEPAVIPQATPTPSVVPPATSVAPSAQTARAQPIVKGHAAAHAPAAAVPPVAPAAPPAAPPAEASASRRSSQPRHLMAVGFTLLGRAGQARAGVLHTRRGDVPTPVFMPVATRAGFRHISLEDARSTGARVILSNTYHLLDAPGPAVFQSFGGIHRFMGWEGAVLTDSGGYQIFSLPGDRSITERGAHFRLPSGRRHLLTPESSIETQQAIGSDIMMALDVCVESTSDEPTTRAAMATTHAWAERSLAAHAARPNGQALFGIVQGGVHVALREESAAAITALPFDGFAIGGLAVGETRAERESMTELCAGLLPEGKPRYLMGVGTPVDLVEAVQRGVDMFDCILPTKMAQQGWAYTFRGVLEVMRPSMQHARGPLEPGCTCLACASQPLGYIHHLLRGGQAQGVRWLALHNIHHTQRLMAQARAAILGQTWQTLYAELCARLPLRIKEPLLAA